MTKSNEPAASRERGSFGFAVLLVALAIVAYVALSSNRPAEPQLIGVPLPPLEVAGWFNGATPIRDEDLRGKVVLVDCWFVDCPPCRAAMPHLVEFYKRFRDPGVVVVGLTPDSGGDVPRAEAFVKSIPGLDWPIGYGAGIPLDILGVHAYPTLILFDKSGRSVWAGHGFGGLEEAALKALAGEKSS
jgi:thiol-disulfide isomerase/thioredoxin